jgi:hypothetical protein
MQSSLYQQNKFVDYWTIVSAVKTVHELVRSCQFKVLSSHWAKTAGGLRKTCQDRYPNQDLNRRHPTYKLEVLSQVAVSY